MFQYMTSRDTGKIYFVLLHKSNHLDKIVVLVNLTFRYRPESLSCGEHLVKVRSFRGFHHIVEPFNILSPSTYVQTHDRFIFMHDRVLLRRVSK